MDYTARRAARGRRFTFVRHCTFLAIAALTLLAGASASAQERHTPSDLYFAHFSLFYDGDYNDALKGFEQDSHNAIKTGMMRWIDSICYDTMMGECFYQMGMMDQALAAYTDALRIYVMYPDWMMRMRFEPNIMPEALGFVKPLPWGVSKRQPKYGHFKRDVLSFQGKTQNENEQAYRQGGVIQQAMLYPVSPQEIIRCTALAISRRAELMGPLGRNDALTADVVSKTTAAIGPANHWSEAWTDLIRGVANVAAGRDAQGVPYLQRSILAAGEFDHPLTCVALLELGRIKLRQGDYKSAANFFEEATYAAAAYSNFGVLEEAFRYAAVTHLVTNQQGVCPLLQPAVTWSNIKFLKASLGLSLAENLAIVGQAHDAAAMLDASRAIIARRNMLAGAAGARLNYLTSLLLFQDHKVNEGQKALADALAYMKHGSLWLFHIKLVDGHYATNGGRAEAARTVMGLYDEVLRDPTPADWALEPLESLAVLTTPHQHSYDNWLEAAMTRKEVQDTAMEISDRARRHRFFTTLPLGGRLESLRWLLEAPAEWLDRQAALQRQDMLARYPRYAKLAEEAQKLRQILLAMPLAPDDKAAVREQATALAELASIASQQELILREIAVRREPADMAFPPMRKTQDIKKALPAGHAILAFYSTPRRTYAFLMNNTKYSSWEVTASTALNKQIVAMLRDMSLFGPVGEVPLKDLSSAKWKQSAAKTLDMLTKNSPADFAKSFQELIVVPDGVMWYLPFEALQVTVDGKQQSLISRFRIRYAPTLGLALSPYPTTRKAGGNAAAVWGKVSPREIDDALKPAREKFQSAIADVVPLKTMPAPSADYSMLMNQLVVFDDLPPGEKDPYDWSPIPLDRGKPGSSVADWLNLPWGHPNEIVLTGYHTAAEDSLKRLGPMKGVGLGNEIFLNVLGLMSTGARTILLSRWRTGGETSYDLAREFVQELPHTSPADSWQRAVLLTMDSRLNLDAEPRVKKAAGEDAPKAEHPFFWAGYMLFDSGEPADEVKAAKDEPVNKAKPPEVKPKPDNPVPPLMPGGIKPDEKPKPEDKLKAAEPKPDEKPNADEKAKADDAPKADEKAKVKDEQPKPNDDKPKDKTDKPKQESDKKPADGPKSF